MKRLILLSVLVFFLLGIPSSFAEPKLPRPTGFVNDFASVIDAEYEAQLVSLLTEVEKSSGIEMVVVTLSSLEGGDLDGMASELFKSWGIGKQGKDNGLLILAAIKDRSLRIEVGYGLEGALNDSYTGRIRREIMNPAFKAGNFGEGFLTASQALATRLQEHFLFELRDVPKYKFTTPEKQSPIPWFFRLIFFLALGYIFIRHPFLFLMFVGSGLGGGGGRSMGGGFGGFGGGLSGGGGSSGRW